MLEEDQEVGRIAFAAEKQLVTPCLVEPQKETGEREDVRGGVRWVEGSVYARSGEAQPLVAATQRVHSNLRLVNAPVAAREVVVRYTWSRRQLGVALHDRREL